MSERALAGDDDGGRRLDRRRALGALGATAAGAWAAPTVLSTSAAAAATQEPPPIPPIPLTLDWNAAFPNPYPSPAGTPNGSLVPPGFTTPASTLVGGRVLITFSHSDPDNIGTVFSDIYYRNFIVYRGDRTAQGDSTQLAYSPLLGGLTDPYFLLQINANSYSTPVNRFVQTTWTFSEPVGGLTFRIDGIDRGDFDNGPPLGVFRYTDVVTVTGSNGVGTVTPSLTPLAPTPSVTTAGATATGIDHPPNGWVRNWEAFGNCLVTFPAPVTSITIRYEPGRLGSNYQYVGVRDLSFTVPGP